MRYSKTHTVQYRLGIGTQKIEKIYVFLADNKIITNTFSVLYCLVSLKMTIMMMRKLVKGNFIIKIALETTRVFKYYYFQMWLKI